MFEAYSLNVEVPATSAIPFKNVTLDKCNDINLSGDSTIHLNRCGVYEVCVDSSATAASTLQLYKNGVAQPQAQSTGTTPGFKTYVQVPTNNSNCPCSSPVTIQVMNPTDAAETLTNVNITVRRL